MYLITNETGQYTETAETFFQPFQFVKNRAGKEATREINYLRQIYQSGIRSGDHVLVIGGSNFKLLKHLAKTVGHRGKLTVLENNLIAYQALIAAQGEKEFVCTKPFSGDPAWDFRTAEERLMAVDLVGVQASLDNLPFADGEFACVWLEDVIDQFPADQQAECMAELMRVSA